MRMILVLLTICLGVQQEVRAQNEDLDSIEAELNKRAPKPKPVPQEKPLDLKATDFSSLGRLSPFSDVAVIERKYLPKTERFQIHGALTTITNDPFFMSVGGVGRFGYFFSEGFGIEFDYFGLTTTERQVTKDLRDKRSVSTTSLVSPKSFTGLDLVWAPIYGKMGLLNKAIVPFDIYFSVGYGATATNFGENAGTLHLGTGQIFAKTKSVAFRWDFSWNFYSANSKFEIKDANGVVTSTQEKKQSFNNLFLSVGMSYFFPEAGYR